jgi:hypothetical protein
MGPFLRRLYLSKEPPITVAFALILRDSTFASLPIRLSAFRGRKSVLKTHVSYKLYHFDL